MCGFPSTSHMAVPHHRFWDTFPLKKTLEEMWKNPYNNLQKKEENTTDLKIDPPPTSQRGTQMVTAKQGCRRVVARGAVGVPLSPCHQVPFPQEDS